MRAIHRRKPASEQLLGALVDDTDIPCAVGNNGRIGRRIEDLAHDVGRQGYFMHQVVDQAVGTPDYRRIKARIRTLVAPERPYVSSPIRILEFA